MPIPSSEFPQQLIGRLRAARHIVALTGAGISAESGLSTFRDAQTGLWAKYRAEDLATAEAFQRNPRLVWEWYTWRRQQAVQAEPNLAHHALAELARRVPRMTLVTQNVDGLHQRAGSEGVVELHGNIHRSKCFREGTIVEGWAETNDVPPRCPHCGSPLRPCVVWFGESLPPGALQAASEVAGVCDLFLSIGTSGLVEPAASLAYTALEQGVEVVEVNPEATPLTPHATYILRGAAGRVLPRLVQAAWPDL